jgi:hypothetical protein
MTSRRCLTTLFLLLLLPLSPSLAPAAAQTVSEPDALELAAMCLTASDFAAAGWADLELVWDWNPTAADLADRAVWPAGAGDERDAVQTSLLAAGWQHAYTASFAVPSDAEVAIPGRQAEVELVAYADTAGATAGFALVPDAYPTGPIEPVTGARTIGDESRLVRVEARDPQAGTPNHELILGFRTGRFTARILLRDWGDEWPQVATIENLGSRLLARIAASAIEQTSPGVGTRHAVSSSPAAVFLPGTSRPVTRTRHAVSLPRRFRTTSSRYRYVVGPKTWTRSFSVSAM